MSLHNFLNIVKAHMRRIEHSPRTASTIAVMDNSLRFMTERNYTSANPAMAAVRGPLIVGLWSVLALSFVVLIWGALVPIESATVAKGSVVLLSSKKTIQHLEGGIINEILVKEGDKVVAGQPLLNLNDTAATAARDTLQKQLYVARITEARLVAERDKLENVIFDKDITETSVTDPELAKAVAAQTQLFESEQTGEEAKLNVLHQRIAQLQEGIEGFKSQIAGVAGQLKLLDEEIDTTQQLLAKGYATKTRLFELERNKSQLEGEHGQYEAEIAKSQQNITETKMEIITRQKEFESKNSQDLRDAQAQVNDLQDKLRATKDVVERTVITAPVSGIVNGLKYHTAGGVITPGTPIMDIIPQDDQLVIEAHLKPTDIAAVHAGLDAKVVFTAYKMRTTPKIPGKVTMVSADTFTDDHSASGTPYYVARIEVDKTFLKGLEKQIEMYPGMPAQIFVRTGSRSFLGYLFKPITDSMHSAFREE